MNQVLVAQLDLELIAENVKSVVWIHLELHNYWFLRAKWYVAE